MRELMVRRRAEQVSKFCSPQVHPSPTKEEEP